MPLFPNPTAAVDELREANAVINTHLASIELLLDKILEELRHANNTA